MLQSGYQANYTDKGRAIRNQRILRSVRPATGQVRTCQTRTRGGATYQSGSPAVRIFASNRVSSSPCIRTRRIGDIAAPPTWTTSCSQAQRGNCQFSETRTGRRPRVADCGFDEDTTRSIRTISLSEQYRSGVASSRKNTPMS